jgi:membrane protease YdiL (CAAX protease family)
VDKKLALSVSRLINLIAILCGAVVSASLALKAGESAYSGLVPLLLVFWVVSPFLALLAANRASRYWPEPRRWALLGLVLAVTAGCLLSYSGVIGLASIKPAFPFLITPLVAWLLIGVVRVMGTLGKRP